MMKSTHFAFAIALAVAFPLWSPATASAQSRAVRAGNAERESATWVKRLDDTLSRMNTARQDLAGYRRQKSESAARHYPVGAAKAAYIQGIKTSEAAYEAARTELPDLIEKARRAGVLPGVLDRYEMAAEAAPSVRELADAGGQQANPGGDGFGAAAHGTDTPESAARNTDTQESDPGSQSHGSNGGF